MLEWKCRGDDMKDVTLVVLAAGMGSRYGGLKQIDPIGPNGEIILELSAYDAIRAGFNKIVFIIKKAIEDEFKKAVGDKIAKHVQVEYVYQEIDACLPKGYEIPEGRVKPWGTAHAVLCCKDCIHEPFAVINADDYYGISSFQKLHDYLINNEVPRAYSLVGFILKNTLTDHGSVARGVCKTEQGRLIGVDERTKIERRDGIVQYYEQDTWHDVDENALVSMNMWGFTPAFIEELDSVFQNFLDYEVTKNPLKSECYIPITVDQLIKANKASVTVLSSEDKWYGVTYQEDKPVVKAGITKLIEDGKYPTKLW